MTCIFPGDSYPGGNFSGEIVREGKNLGDNCPGASCPGGLFGGNYLGSKIPGVNCPWWNFMGKNCPGSSYPVGIVIEP